MTTHQHGEINNDEIDSSRMEAFSDGVLAVIITIMVLELRAPAGHDFHALRELLPIFLAYVLSFSIVGIYWNNHHHLLRAAKHINPRIMWANLLLLFWLSLIPFFTSWLGENYKRSFPTAAYGILLLLCAFSYTNLQLAIVAHHGKDSALAIRLGKDVKGKLSLLGYALATALAFINHWPSDFLFVAVALIWFIPDKRLA